MRGTIDAGSRPVERARSSGRVRPQVGDRVGGFTLHLRAYLNTVPGWWVKSDAGSLFWHSDVWLGLDR